MEEEITPKNLFQLFLIILGIIYLFLRAADSAATEFFLTILIVLGILYIGYNVITMENPIGRVLYIIFIGLGIFLILLNEGIQNVGDCSLDNPCSSNQFCGQDHVCHDFPELTATTTKITIERHVNFTSGGIIIGLGIIIFALILRKKSNI